jgi:hypothetical protein
VCAAPFSFGRGNLVAQLAFWHWCHPVHMHQLKRRQLAGRSEEGYKSVAGHTYVPPCQWSARSLVGGLTPSTLVIANGGLPLKYIMQQIKTIPSCIMICTFLTFEFFLGDRWKKYKRSIFYEKINFLYILYLSYIYYKIDLRDALLYNVVSKLSPFYCLWDVYALMQNAIFIVLSRSSWLASNSTHIGRATEHVCCSMLERWLPLSFFYDVMHFAIHNGSWKKAMRIVLLTQVYPPLSLM